MVHNSQSVKLIKCIEYTQKTTLICIQLNSWRSSSSNWLWPSALSNYLHYSANILENYWGLPFGFPGCLWWCQHSRAVRTPLGWRWEAETWCSWCSPGSHPLEGQSTGHSRRTCRQPHRWRLRWLLRRSTTVATATNSSWHEVMCHVLSVTTCDVSSVNYLWWVKCQLLGMGQVSTTCDVSSVNYLWWDKCQLLVMCQVSTSWDGTSVNYLWWDKCQLLVTHHVSPTCNPSCVTYW